MTLKKHNGCLPRRGISVVVVLTLIAMTLAMSYALTRVEFYTANLQQNTNRNVLARQAAMVGLTVAIRKMERSTWAGTGTTLSGSLNSNDSYSVTYTVGDSSLNSASSSYWEYPYRVTLLSTGVSVDPNHSNSRATHKVQAVVRLIPRQLASGPTDLATVANYTWYQSSNDTFQFQVPLHVQGKVRVQGTVTLGNDYQWANNSSNRYLDDLDLMRQAGLPDYRPFSGPLEISFNQNNGIMQSWLTSTLGVSLINNTATGMTSQWVFPSALNTYRLYTGGPQYTVPTAPSTISGTLQADPVTNPLGLFYNAGNVTFANNSTLKGTLISGGTVDVSGANTTYAPVDLMPLQGSTNKFRLPTVLANSDFLVNGGSQTIDGLIVSFYRLNFKMCSQSKVLTMQGNLVAPKFIVAGRNEFNQSSFWWSLAYSGFMSQLNNPPATRIAYFPLYLNGFGLLMAPNVTFSLPSTTPTYVWPTDGVTIFVANASDGGLRWELISWQDLH